MKKLIGTANLNDYFAITVYYDTYLRNFYYIDDIIVTDFKLLEAGLFSRSDFDIINSMVRKSIRDKKLEILLG